jgi:hypothetical protein
MTSRSGLKASSRVIVSEPGTPFLPVKKLADYGRDDHPADDPERAQVAWAVAALDDCDACNDLRVELTVEEVGRPGAGLVAHLSPETARRLAHAIETALRDIGEST